MIPGRKEQVTVVYSPFNDIFTDIYPINTPLLLQVIKMHFLLLSTDYKELSVAYFMSKTTFV